MKSIKSFFSNLRIGFDSSMENIQASGKSLLLICISSIILMIAICVAVFFIAVKGSEEVLVPDVIGKTLAEAVQDMQVKELFPKIQLRYSDIPGDEGTILEQEPVAGSIVKASRHINLIVSRGVVIDQIEDYTGLKLDDLKMKLQTLFSGSAKPLITLSEPMYKADMSEAGTILEQNPPAGTQISQPIEVQLVVSRGPTYEKTRVPYIVGMSINDILAQMSRSRIAFDFTAEYSQDDSEDAKTGYVVSQEETNEFIENYGRLSAVLMLPNQPVKGNTYGIFSAKLQNFPYALSMKLEALNPDGEQYTLTTFSHPGGNLTIPYAVPAGTKLTLFIEGKENKTITVR